MKLAGVAGDAFAVIVGVERCAAYASDPLVGPVSNALACADWCLERGVPGGRIAMFVSAKEVSQRTLDAWAARRGIPIRDATEKTIQTFIARELSGLGRGGPLLFFWSGHGVIDQRQGQARRLFYEDTHPDLAYNLDVVGLVNTLRDARFSDFPQQVFTVDACASYSFGLGSSRGLIAPTEFGRVPAAAQPIRQWVMLSAAPGQLAFNDPAPPVRDQAAARFTRLLLKELPTRGDWPDFEATFKQLRREFESVQTPVCLAYGPGDVALSDNGVQPLSSIESTDLLVALRKAGLADDALRRCALAAWGGRVRTGEFDRALEGGAESILDMFADTAQARDELTLLQRLSEHVVRKLSGARANGVFAWQDRHCEEQALDGYRRQLDQASARPGANAVCFLLIDERSDDGEGLSQYNAFLFVESDPVPTALAHGRPPIAAGKGATRAREEVLTAIFALARAQAARRGIADPRFVVEMSLPTDRIDDDLASLSYLNRQRRPQKIEQTHLVVRRLSDRLRDLADCLSEQDAVRGDAMLAADQWRRRAATLRERFDRSGLRVTWVERSAFVAYGAHAELEDDSAACCVGLQGDTRLARGVRNALYDKGLPFACWHRTPWTEADERRMADDLAAHVGATSLRRLFELRQRGKHPATGLSILWDDPARDPYNVKLNATKEPR